MVVPPRRRAEIGGRDDMFEYKVLTERDKVFSGAFDPAALERVLNEYAADGWRLAEGFMAASVWKSAKAEIVMILERSRGDG
jgi:Domain of unknown function (DUF4177)